MQKEKYNVSSRSINQSDIERLNKYQKELINTMIYDKSISKSFADAILCEIREVESFIKKYYQLNLQCY